MPKVSRKPLNKDVENAIVTQLWDSIAKIHNQTEAFEFFSDVLTNTEQIMVAKRLAVAILLIRDKSPTDIRNAINVSYSMIGNVASWLKNSKKKTRKILLGFSKEKNWEDISDKIEEILESFQPAPFTDWKRVGYERYKKARERSARKTIR